MHSLFYCEKKTVKNESVKVKPNAAGKLWTKIERDKMPNCNEEEWLRRLGLLIDDFKNKKLTIIRILLGALDALQPPFSSNGRRKSTLPVNDDYTVQHFIYSGTPETDWIYKGF